MIAATLILAATLTGRVTVERDVVPFAKVTLTSHCLDEARTTFADTNGKFVFENVCGGCTYEIAAEREGFVVKPRQRSLWRVADGETVRVKLRMDFLPGSFERITTACAGPPPADAPHFTFQNDDRLPINGVMAGVALAPGVSGP